MDIQEIIAELKNETARLSQAIAALEGLGSREDAAKTRALIKTATVIKMRQVATGKKTRRVMTEEGRKRISEAMKKRWASRRKSA